MSFVFCITSWYHIDVLENNFKKERLVRFSRRWNTIMKPSRHAVIAVPLPLSPPPSTTVTSGGRGIRMYSKQRGVWCVCQRNNPSENRKLTGAARSHGEQPQNARSASHPPTPAPPAIVEQDRSKYRSAADFARVLWQGCRPRAAPGRGRA